jgi:hypothetical protein
MSTSNDQSMSFWQKARLAQIGIVNAPFILLGIIVLIIILFIWALKQSFVAKNQGLCGGWSGPTTFPLFMRNNPVAGQPDIWWLPTDYDNGPWINRMLF